MPMGQPSRALYQDIAENGSTAVGSWYDAAHEMYLVLIRRENDASPPLLSEQVEFRLVPIQRYDDDNGKIEAFKDIHRTTRTLKVQFPPVPGKDQNTRSTDVGESTVELCARLPLDVKLSLDQQVLALQLTPSLVWIVPVDYADASSRRNTNQKQWTIDLSSGTPTLSLKGPDFIRDRHRSNNGQSSSSTVSEISNERDSTTEGQILTGGIVWSDHGGNSQDLMVITTKAVICFKISLSRNQMAVTHTFKQSPPASAIWYDPQTRSVVVGSIGSASSCSNVPKDLWRNDGGEDVQKHRRAIISTVQLRTFLLPFPPTNKPTRGLPRLELPPPRRLPLYAVGRSRLLRLASSKGVFELNGPIITPKEIRLTNLYGICYMIELEPSQIGLQLVAHRVDSSLGIIYYKTYTIEELRLTQVEMESVAVNIVDNILFLSFRTTTVFLDILDTENTYYLEAVDTEAGPKGSRSHSLVPNILKLGSKENNGMAIPPLQVTVEKLEQTLPLTPSVVPFFLRRQSSPRCHAIAASKLVELLLPSKDNSSSVSSTFQQDVRRRTMNLIVQMYVGCDKEDIVRDLVTGSSLLYKSALLPADSVFRYHSVDVIVSSRRTQHISSHHAPTSFFNQSEVLGTILLPHAKTAIDQKSNAPDRLRSVHQVLEFAIALMGALDQSQCPTCPALECLIFSLLWQLGYEQEMEQFLMSRCYSVHQLHSSKQYHHQSALDAGTMVFVRLMRAIGLEVPFGVLRGTSITTHSPGTRNTKFFGLVKKWSTRILLSRVSNVNIAIAHLLADDRMVDSINYYLRAEHKPTPNHKDNTRHRRRKEFATTFRGKKERPASRLECSLLDDDNDDLHNFVGGLLDLRYDIEPQDRLELFCRIRGRGGGHDLLSSSTDSSASAAILSSSCTKVSVRVRALGGNVSSTSSFDNVQFKGVRSSPGPQILLPFRRRASL